jgi:hypothetical protein
MEPIWWWFCKNMLMAGWVVALMAYSFGWLGGLVGLVGAWFYFLSISRHLGAVDKVLTKVTREAYLASIPDATHEVWRKL